MLIDCDTCTMQATTACRDCVVTLILELSPVAEVDAAELTALSHLADAGLVPPLRLVPTGESGAARRTG